jgi:hypothetical protein
MRHHYLFIIIKLKSPLNCNCQLNSAMTYKAILKILKKSRKIGVM